MVSAVAVVVLLIVSVVVILLGLVIIRSVSRISVQDLTPPPRQPELSTLPNTDVTLAADSTMTVALWSSDVYLADTLTITISAGKYTSQSLAATLNSRQPLVLIDRFNNNLLRTAYQIWFDNTETRKYSMIAKRIGAVSSGSYTVSFEAEPSVMTTLGIVGVSTQLTSSFIQLPIGTATIFKYRRIT